MNKLALLLLLSILSVNSMTGQTISDLVNKVDQDTLVKILREFSGEDAATVNGNPVTILNRESDNNDVAADYLVEKLSALSNITVNDHAYSVNGRNIIATQLGKVTPNNIFIICAHYDTVDDYCADDNASGTTAVLEVARILSTQCMDNTIIYALWDEEEDGLLGSKNYADTAAANGDNILGVLNLDMMAYDGDGDNDFDIDVRNLSGSLALKDDFLAVLAGSGLNLNVNVVNPGSTASDHFWFWNNGYPAIFVGESWANGDQTPEYHKATDRFSTLDIDYFTDMTRLVLNFMATKTTLSAIDNTVSLSPSNLMANQSGATYQWLDCDNGNAPIPSETNQAFTPSSNGNYAVQITVGSFVEISDCISFNTLSIPVFSKEQVDVYPNPVFDKLHITFKYPRETKLAIVNIEGKTIYQTVINKADNEIVFSEYANGVYFINLEADGRTISYKVVKE